MSPYRGFESYFDRIMGIYPDSEDGTMTARSADLLGVKEFAFFRLAYRWWFGEEAVDDVIEKPFMYFLKTRVAPPWVRHFAREILELERDGRLDRTNYGLPVPARASPMLLRIDEYLRTAYVFVWIFAVAAIVIGIGF